MVKQISMPKSIIIHPEHMIHGLGLKGADLLIYAFIFSVYNLTEKPVHINKTYLSELFGYSRRCIIAVVIKMIECGTLVEIGSGLIPAFFMTKSHYVKKVHTSVKKVHINDNCTDKKKDNINKKESFIKKELQRIINTPWLED